MRAARGISLRRQAVGVAAAVEAFVRGAHEQGDLTECRGGGDDPLADLEWRDAPSFAVVEGTGFVEDRVGDGDLADVV